MNEPFVPTHRMQIGTGKKRNYRLVRAIGPLIEKEGIRYYNAITSFRSKGGSQEFQMVPETRLKPLPPTERHRRKGKIHPSSCFHVLCPFCGFAVAPSNPFKWCANCYVEYEEDAKGVVWFDERLKREEYFLAKALSKAGGAQMGTITKIE